MTTKSQEELKFLILYKYLGTFIFSTPDELLQAALEAEQTRKYLGPFDSSYEFYVQKQMHFEAAAALMESNPPFIQKYRDKSAI